MFTFRAPILISVGVGAGKNVARLGGIGIRSMGRKNMDANTAEKPSSATGSGLDTVRARALKQKHVRFRRNFAENEIAVRSSLQKLRTLKIKSAEELPADESEQPWYTHMWSILQQLLGNR